MGVVAPSTGSSAGGGNAVVSGKTAVGGDCRELTTWKGGGVEGEDADADRSQTDVGSRGWDALEDSWDALIPCRGHEHSEIRGKDERDMKWICLPGVERWNWHGVLAQVRGFEGV
jgi:hypothetical protein